MNKSKKNKKERKLPYKKTYSQEDINKALQEVEKGSSTWKAAAIYKVPRSTLYAKLKGRIPVEGVKGPGTYLTNDEENIIVNWILYCGTRGFPITKSQLLDCVQKLIVDLKRDTPFKDNKPGQHWYESFCRRHPEISQRIAQNLNTSRASATEIVLRNWFREVEDHLRKLNLKDIDPSRIYNLDESAFFLIPKADKVLARKGSKSVYKVVHGNDKESITVLFTVNGKGTMLPPMILYWYERLPAAVINNLPSEWIAGNTERGWMTGESFYSYIKDQFYPWLVKNKIQFPIILYVDRHVSHLTLPLSQFCKENQIELIALYPNATHILQPLDGVFHPLKSKWKKTVDQWRIDNNAQGVKREHFASILKKALDSMTNLPDIIKQGFRTCGLSPFCADSVDYNILNKKQKNVTQNIEFISQDATETSNKDQEEAKCHLKYFESKVNADILEDFRNAVASGTVEIFNQENKGLFNYWLKMKRHSGY